MCWSIWKPILNLSVDRHSSCKSVLNQILVGDSVDLESGFLWVNPWLKLLFQFLKILCLDKSCLVNTLRLHISYGRHQSWLLFCVCMLLHWLDAWSSPLLEVCHGLCLFIILGQFWCIGCWSWCVAETAVVLVGEVFEQFFVCFPKRMVLREVEHIETVVLCPPVIQGEVRYHALQILRFEILSLPLFRFDSSESLYIDGFLNFNFFVRQT